MKFPILFLLLFVLALCLLLTLSCAGWDVSVRGPYGGLESRDGVTVVTPLPILVPTSGK